MKKRIVWLLCVAAALGAGCSGGGAPQAGDGGVDMDLSALSSVLAYAQVVNILESPDGYLGKTIKVTGRYYPSYYQPTGLYYHFVMVGDEALCCQAGLEFTWKGAFPDDYPEEETVIEVVGVLVDHQVLGNTYYRLAVDGISIL